MGKAPPPEDESPLLTDPLAGPSLAELDRFTVASQRQWLTAAKRVDKLQRALYFGLERSRNERTKQLLGALRFAARQSFDLKHWSRIVDHQYTLDPLSLTGSHRKSGRFHIGADLNPVMFTPFPALYLGEHYEVAFHECFGNDPTAKRGGLTAHELALRAPSSFTHVRVRGHIDRVLDLDDSDALAEFAKIIGSMAMPKEVTRLVRELGLKRGPSMIRNGAMLRRQLLTPNWRANPMQFDLPANSQIFGRIAAAAGIHALLYPSVRAGGGRCLALYIQNWPGSTSYVELEDSLPPNMGRNRWDGRSSVG